MEIDHLTIHRYFYINIYSISEFEKLFLGIGVINVVCCISVASFGLIYVTHLLSNPEA